MALSVDDAQREYDQLEETIIAARQRQEQLKAWIEMGNQLAANSAANSSTSTDRSHRKQKKSLPDTSNTASLGLGRNRTGNPTAETAYSVLARHRRLRLGVLVAMMRQAGWSGLGDSGRDSRAVWAAMDRRRDLFNQLGTGEWAAYKRRRRNAR